MSGAPRARLWINGAALGLLVWLYGGDLLDGLRARRAEVSALAEPPQLGFAVGVLVLGLMAAGVTVWGWWKQRDDDFRGYRLLPILTSLAVFADLFVLGEDQGPYQSHEVVAAVVGQLELRASQLSGGGRVPDGSEVLTPVLAELGRPPYLVRGERLSAWRLEVRRGCQGPVVEPGGLPPGVLIYCVAPDRAQAWITATGLPWEERFGPPGIVRTPRGILLGQVRPAPPPGTEDGAVGPPPAPPGVPPAGG